MIGVRHPIAIGSGPAYDADNAAFVSELGIDQPHDVVTVTELSWELGDARMVTLSRYELGSGSGVDELARFDWSLIVGLCERHTPVGDGRVRLARLPFDGTTGEVWVEISVDHGEGLIDLCYTQRDRLVTFMAAINDVRPIRLDMDYESHPPALTLLPGGKP